MSAEGKALESHMNDVMVLYTYAAIEDIRAKWNGGGKFQRETYQHYDNLTAKVKKLAKPLSVFTISTDVRQQLAHMWKCMIDELDNIDITPADTFATVLEKLQQENADCYSAFMFGLAAWAAPFFGRVLIGAVDEKQYFNLKTSNAVQNHKTKTVMMAQVYDVFNCYLKAIAWIFASHMWYDQGSISSGFFLGVLSARGMDQILLDGLQNCLRAKVPKVAATQPAQSTVQPSESVLSSIDQAVGAVEPVACSQKIELIDLAI